MIGFLLAMEAAGAVVNYANTQYQKKLIEQGRRLEQAAIESNLEAVRLESNQESLAAIQQLRKNLGTQIAINAARGTSSSAGSAAMFGFQSMSSFYQDERTRRMNLLSREAQLRAQNVLSGLHTTASETALGQQFVSNTINRIPIIAISSGVNNAFTSQGNYGLKPASF